MKKILPWLLLLLLLIIFCVWTKKDSIHISSNGQIESALTPMIATDKRYISYTIIQEDSTNYTLRGNFKNTNQQASLTSTFHTVDKKLLIKNTSTNDTLLGEPVLELTHKILPHFMAQYVEGKISYTDQKLKISGTATSYEAQREMQRLLNTSTIASQDNSNVATAKPITYNINKTHDKLHVQGIFNDNKQLNSIRSTLPLHATTDMKVVSHHKDNGSLPAVKSFLPIFLSKYTSGKIDYADEKLMVSGMVQSEADLAEIATLLKGADILISNHTIVDPSVKEAADLAKQKVLEASAKKQATLDAEIAIQEADRKAQELADADAAAQEADRRAQELADADAAAQEADRRAQELADADAAAQEADRRAQELADAATQEADRRAKELADADAKEAERKVKEAEVQTKIENLFKLGNIEFNVNKSTLTSKGQNTVNKLASILTEYATMNIEIAGHTDSDGSAKYNQKLSQSRVDMVKTKLIEQKILASRLTAKGYGETKPLVANTTRENKAKNRRVEINILGE